MRPRLQRRDPWEADGAAERLPSPLSETVSFQADPSNRKVMRMLASLRFVGKAYFTAFMTSSVTIRPMLTASALASVPASAVTSNGMLRFNHGSRKAADELGEVGRLRPV